MQDNNNISPSTSATAPAAPTAPTTPTTPQIATANPTTKENIPLGTLGAVLGSIAGGLAIILLDRLGFVASVSGVVMAYGTLWLYQKFAKGLSGKGIAICIVVIILMTLLAENVACSIRIVEELNEGYGISASFGDVFGNFYALLADGVIDSGVYAGSLVAVYAFTALGAFGVIKTSFNQKGVSLKQQNNPRG